MERRGSRSSLQPWTSPTITRRLLPRPPVGMRLASSVSSWTMSANFGRMLTPNQPLPALIRVSSEPFSIRCSESLGPSHHAQAKQKNTSETRRRPTTRRNFLADMICMQSGGPYSSPSGGGE